MTGDRELLESLMFDAEATRGAMSGWLKENFEDSPNGGTFRKYVEHVHGCLCLQGTVDSRLAEIHNSQGKEFPFKTFQNFIGVCARVLYTAVYSSEISRQSVT